MTTLVEAIEDKFEMLSEPHDRLQHMTLLGSSSAWARRFRTASGSLSLPPVLVMDNSGVSAVGDVDRLGQMCGHVTELDLCNNQLDDWPSILDLLGRLPRLRWLNLSINPLLRPPAVPDLQPPVLQQLTTLVLNKVPLTWQFLAAILSAAPSVSELHLCNNPSLGQLEDCHSAGGYPAVQQLYFNGNRFQSGDWARLAAWFPNLEKLTLIDNAIRALPDGGPLQQPLLAGLKSLNLSENCIADWAELEKLNAYPMLSDLRVLDINLAKGRPKGEFRSEAVARLPHVAQLNGTPVSDEERTTAERAFIRRCTSQGSAAAETCSSSDEQRPAARLAELEAKHGRLEQLANVDMKAVESVNLVLRYEGQSRTCTLITSQSMRDVKRLVCAEFKLEPARVDMYYIDQGMIGAMGPELMNLPGRAFHSYRPEDGDELVLRDRN